MTPRSVMRTALLAGVVLSASCTTATGPEETDTETVAKERVCINTRAVRSFDAFDDEHVYVHERTDKHFLLTTRSRCRDLRYSVSIALSDTTNRVCSGGFGKIIYRAQLLDGDLGSCTIGSIESVHSKEHAEMVYKVRTGQAPPPGEETWTELPAEEDK